MYISSHGFFVSFLKTQSIFISFSFLFASIPGIKAKPFFRLSHFLKSKSNPLSEQSPSKMPFCSYALYRGRNDFSGLTERYVVITPNRAIADQFYRGIQEQVIFRNSNVEVRPERLAANMWTWEATAADDLREVIDRINSGSPSDIMLETEYLRTLRGKVYIQKCGEYESRVFPYVHDYGIADHISGNTFFIRNQFDPNEFWYFEKGTVRVSTRNRSRFRIETAKRSNIKDLVMVDSDMVTLSHVQGSNQTPISVDEEGYLFSGNGKNRAIEFGCFKGSFETQIFSKPISNSVFEDGKSSELIGYPQLAWGDSASEEKTGQVWELC